MKNRKLILSIIGLFLLAIIAGSSIFFYQKYKEHENAAQERLDALAAQEAADAQNGKKIVPFDYEDYRARREADIESELAKPDSSESLITEEEKQPDYVKKPIKEAGWIPNWDYQSGVTSLRANGSDFDSISPVWYAPIPDGTLDIKRSSNFRDLIYYGKQQGIEIIPSIASSDPDLLKTIFDSDEIIQTHVDNLINEVDLYDYDGLDIDYEAIYLSNKEGFFDFIKLLNTELNKRDKTLSIAVLSQWGDNMIYPSLNETRKVQDWAELSQVADQIRIMTYDFHVASSPVAGPIAPLYWMEDVIKYAIKKIPKDKIWLGIHLYSYEWASNGTSGSYTYDVLADIVGGDPEQHYNQTYQEGYYKYDCDTDITCEIYYQTKKGVEARQNLAKKYDVAGVTYWRVGREDSLLAD